MFRFTGQCGSCWAFASTGSLEGVNFRKSKNLVSLSDQNLLDCSTSFGNQGCNGGIMDYAYDYIKSNGGIDTEAFYPYTGMEGNCTYNATKSAANVTGYVKIPAGNEAALLNAVAANGPIAVAMDGTFDFLQL